MKFSSLSIMASSFASKLMGISTAENLISAGSSSAESPNSFFQTFLTIVKSTFTDLAYTIWTAIMSILYIIVKWMLTILDFLFIFIREIIGLNGEFTSLQDISESDMVFQFIFSEEVTAVLKGMLGLAIILIIIFSIFAIVKSEYDFVAHGKASNSKKGILVNSLKSLLMMILVPVIAIGGIVLVNSILKSLYIATAGGVDASIGSQIFVTSAYNANAYRSYANGNMKIPITFNFEDIQETDNVTGWGSEDASIEELDQALKDFKSSSVWNRGLTTFYMFYTDAFFDMDAMDKLDKIYMQHPDLTNPYNLMYDMGIHTRKEEYYVMADVVDYAIKSRQVIYFKTAEEIFESYYDLYTSAPPAVRNQMENAMEMPIVKNGDNYEFYVHFEGEKSATQYSHKAGSTDEAEGAVFMIAIEKTIEYNNDVYTYYYPLQNSGSFETDYYADIDQPVVARGVFENGENPTAIKERDGEVIFYRDNLNIPTLTEFFPTISYEMPPDGVTENLGVKLLKMGVKAFTGVDADQFIPYVYYSIDIFNLFGKSRVEFVSLDNGYMNIDYNFSQRDFNMENLFHPGKFNMLIAVFSSIILLGMLIKVLFGVTFRVLDITLLFISYPAVLSTMPLDNGGRFEGWTQTFIQKLLNMYGIVIGINIMLLLLPIIDGLELITPSMVATAFGGKLFSGVTSRFLNFLVEMLFILVGLTSIERFASIIDKLFDKKQENTLIQDGAQVVNDLAKIPKTAANIYTGKFAMDIAEKAIDSVYSMVPGGAMMKAGADFVKHRKAMKEMKADEKEIRDKIKKGDTSGFEEPQPAAPENGGDNQANPNGEAPQDPNDPNNPNGNGGGDGSGGNDPNGVDIDGGDSDPADSSSEAPQNPDNPDGNPENNPGGDGASSGLNPENTSSEADQGAEAPADAEGDEKPDKSGWTDEQLENLIDDDEVMKSNKEKAREWNEKAKVSFEEYKNVSSEEYKTNKFGSKETADKALEMRNFLKNDRSIHLIDGQLSLGRDQARKYEAELRKTGVLKEGKNYTKEDIAKLYCLEQLTKQGLIEKGKKLSNKEIDEIFNNIHKADEYSYEVSNARDKWAHDRNNSNMYYDWYKENKKHRDAAKEELAKRRQARQGSSGADSKANETKGNNNSGSNTETNTNNNPDNTGAANEAEVKFVEVDKPISSGDAMPEASTGGDAGGATQATSGEVKKDHSKKARKAKKAQETAARKKSK